MNYELDTLAAVVQLPEPTTKGISTITGMSERKVRLVLDTLVKEYGVSFDKERVNRSMCYRVRSWGVFDPEVMTKRLMAIDLIQVKAARIKKRTKVVLTRQQKAEAYRQSLRLEGIAPADLPEQGAGESRADYKARIIAQFRHTSNGG